MAAADHQTDLVRVVATASGGRDATTDRTSGTLLATGIALAILQTPPAGAVSLGELRVESALGQPFVGTTTVRLGPGESLSGDCISAPAVSGADLAGARDLTVVAPTADTPGVYPVEIRSARPMYEPMYEMRLQLKCPGEVALTKQFVVMLNLPMAAPLSTPAGRPAPAPQQQTVEPRTVINPPATARSQPSSGQLAASAAPVTAGTTYRVRRGDTLSRIAERVRGRPAGSLWTTAERIFAANPQAFVRGNRDLIKLGYTLTIPAANELADTTATASPAANEPAAAASSTATMTTPAPGSRSDTALNTELGRPEEPAATATAATADAVATTDARVTELAAALAASRAANTAAQAQIDSALARVAELETRLAAAAQPATPSSPAPAPETTAPPDPARLTAPTPRQPAELHPALAALLGVGAGLALALLLLGRRLLARARGSVSQHAAPLQPVTDQAAAMPRSMSTESAHAGSEQAGSARPGHAASEFGAAGIEVEYEIADAAAATSAADGDSRHTATGSGFDLASGTDSDTDGGTDGSDVAEPTINESPRVSLRDEFGVSSDTDNGFDALLDGIEDSGTMRSLFETDAADMPTAELPGIDAGYDDADNNDTQDSDTSNDLLTLNRRLEMHGADDEELSATLTQALGLLEQDYEDELSASQILERDEATTAIQRPRPDDTE